MSRWVIGIPCWGERYVRIFIDIALHYHRAALDGFKHEVHYVIHTDSPEEISLALAGAELTVLPVPFGYGYSRFGAAHAEALALAGADDRVALMGADQIISCEYFRAMEARFAQGYKAVCGLGHRTCAADYPGQPVSAAALNRWAMTHAHPIIRELFWGTGKSGCPSLLFFQEGDSIVMRAFGLGPLGFIKDRYLSFEGTIDNDLASNYDKHEIHVVTECDELATATVDHPDNTHGVFPHPITAQHVAAWAALHTNEIHKWFFTHRIRVQGNGECGDAAVVEEILKEIPGFKVKMDEYAALHLRPAHTHAH